MDWKTRQNPDGGWGYSRGCSWTEPTALVLLAQAATGSDRESFAAGSRFLRAAAGADGGYRPQAGVAESTWVTSLVTLLPEAVMGEPEYWRALQWLKGQTGRESSWSYRLRQRIAGNTDSWPKGWPWFPGAAAWVIPTSFGILAFQKALQRRDDASARERVAAGKEFLLARMCADGGWNHGSNKALGRDGDSYPETTGIALLALHGSVPSAALEKAKNAARVHMRTCRTAEGIAWLRMGLAAHGERLQNEPSVTCRTTLDDALTALASAKTNPLL